MESEQNQSANEAAIAQIWQGDLLDRKKEAAHLIAYIESVADRPIVREDKKAYTIAVDARYGEGKTFFLQRLTEQLRLEHPVAFVDAWADDLANEPLTALAATMKEALAPFMKQAEVKDRFDDFMSRAGKVAKIAGKGLLRRSIGFAIGASATDAAEAVLMNVPDELNDALAKAGDGLAEDADDAISALASNTLMEKRITEFEEGQAAIEAMKVSLTAIVSALEGSGRRPPIVIVIDELDRCRPTYAIKLLEEIKHLFDVPGIVFLLAMHGEQLGHSVSGSYGASFDGRSYLRRFIDREYRLKRPHLEKLLEILWPSHRQNRTLQYPIIVEPEVREEQWKLPRLLAEYMHIYGLGPRDAFQLVDMLETSIALADGQTLYLAYLIPLAIGQMQGLPTGALPLPMNASRYKYVPDPSRTEKTPELTFPEMAEAIKAELGKGWKYYASRSEGGFTGYVWQIASRDDNAFGGGSPIWSPSGYPRLIETVERFHNPEPTQ